MSTVDSPPSRSARFMAWVVAHHRLVLGAWVVAAVALVTFAPPFVEVAVRDPSSFLPDDAAVIEGAELVTEGWPDATSGELVVVASREDGPLTAADTAYLERLVAALDPATGTVDGIETLSSPLDADDPVAAALRSDDGQAVLLTLSIDAAPFTPGANTIVAELRGTAEALGPPTGLEVGATGIAAIGADQDEVVRRTTEQTSVLSAVLVLTILLLIFRSPVTPLVPLLTVGLAMTVANGIVSLLAQAGMEVTDLYESVATVVIFGAGTDYGLFMVSRYREQTKGFADVGTPPIGLVTTAAALVTVITGSAGTTIVGFASQSVAEFGLYRTLGPALAIAMAVALVAGLTLGPALIRLFGSYLYWPRRPLPAPVAGGAGTVAPPLHDSAAAGATETGIMHRVADLVDRRPGRIAVSIMVAMVALGSATGAIRLDRDELNQLPDDAASALAFRSAEQHFGSGQLNPIQIVIDAPDARIDGAAEMRALGTASTNLLLLEGVDTVRSLALPTSGELPEEIAQADGGAPMAQLGGLQGQLGDAADGAARLEDGIVEVSAGTTQLAEGLAQLRTELPAATDGAGRIAEGAAQALDGARALRDGAAEARDGARRVADGAAELADGLGEAEDGARQLRAEVATPAEASVTEAMDALRSFTVGLSDPQYLAALEATGETFALLTGRYPDGHPQAGQQVDPAYDGLAPALGALADGLDDAVTGATQLAAGARGLADGLAQLVAGLDELVAGLEQLAAGSGELSSGLAEAQQGVDALAEGAAELSTGVSTQLAPGAGALASGLAQGVDALDPAAVEALEELFGGGGPFVLTAGMIQDPELRSQLSVFVTDDGHRARIFVAPTTGPYDPASLELVGEAVDVVERSLESSPLAGATVRPTGTTAFAVGMADAVDRDLPIIATAVILGLLLVMGGLLRSVVAPLYMVASVLLSYATALGVTTIVFQGILGEPGIVWYVPSFLFVLLIALGVDYNIFLIGRAREEAETTDTRTAVRRAVIATGPTITTAGIILVGTFSVLALAPMSGIRQLGVAAATGIVIDTFVVRPMLVPAIARILGRLNWWPDARWQRA